MGRISFIGLGLYDDSSLTLQALQECKEADILIMESYTSTLAEGSVKRLEERIGKTVQLLSREQVEKGDFLSGLKQNRVAFLVPGDPMTATTHVDLRIRAHDLGFETRVIHGTSALIAVPGILGLQHYKFGRTITIPYAQKGFRPKSPIEQLMQNRAGGLHTLALLDIWASENRYMTANEGLRWLLDTARETGVKEISESSLACVVARAGAPDFMARADRIGKLLSIDFGPPLHSIVIPGRLHFIEVEALKRFANAPEDLKSD
ncbi:MAG: diphthine synthase [Thermoplasmata archaeon]